MPGFDGTGPRGLGPLTGRGRGFCLTGISPVSAPVSAIQQRPLYSRPYRGRGFGRGHGGGRGAIHGRGRWSH